MSFDQLRNYSSKWCRENLFSPEKLEKYLKSEQYVSDVQSRVTYAGHDNVVEIISVRSDVNLSIFEKRELYEIVLDNHPKIDIESVYYHYLFCVANFRWADELPEKYVEYSKIIKLFTSYYFNPKILSKNCFLARTDHLDVLNLWFHTGVDVNITYFTVGTPYFKLVVSGGVFGKSLFVLKKLLQTDVRIKNDVGTKCMLACAQYNRFIENTLIFALLIEFV